MIANDIELQGTQERIAYFCRLLANMRVAAKSPKEYRQYSNSYVAEIEKMHGEIIEYLSRHSSEAVTAEAA